MFAAPPVQLTLPNGRRERWAVALISTVAAASLGGWLWAWLAPSATGPVMAASVVGLAALCGRIVWQQASPLCGELAWDGQAWWYTATAQPAAQQVGPVGQALDLGSWVMLRTASGAWCGVHVNDPGVNWHGLKLVLRSTQPDENRRRAT